MTFIYTYAFIASFVMLFVLLLQYYKRISAYYIMLFVSIVIFCFGHLVLARADNLPVAIIGKQIMYLGSAFTPFFMVMCIADLCKINVKTIFQVLFIIVGAMLFAAATSIGVTDWYYGEVSLYQYAGVTVMAKNYGPVHFLYPLMLLVSSVVCLVFIAKSFRTKRQVSYISSIFMLVTMLLSIGVYLAERIVNYPLELLPLAYIVGEAIVLMLVERISMYDVVSISADSYSDSNEYGFMLFNDKGIYYGSDETAKVWFPEVAALRIDSKIKNPNTDFLQQVSKWIEGTSKENLAYFERNDRVIKAEYLLNKCVHGKNRYIISLIDDTEQQKYTKLMEGYNETLSKEVKLRTDKIIAMSEDMLVDMAMIVDSRDGNTGGHIKRTGDVVEIFVRHLQSSNTYVNLTPRMINSILKAAILHDFGKIAVSDTILNKPGRFDDWEYEIMKTHAQKGSELVGQMIKHMDDEVFKQVAVNVCYYHHEKWDGSGYPTGISGESIPFEARIMALADVFDALVSKRVYKERMSYDDAFRIIEESAGTHFDPELCKEFLKCRDKIEELYNSYTED